MITLVLFRAFLLRGSRVGLSLFIYTNVAKSTTKQPLSGQTESDENANTEELPNHFMALERNTKLPTQHKPQSYRTERSNNDITAETNEGLNLHFNALRSSQRSYNAKERIKRQIAVIRNTISCHKNK